jgi:nitrate reductase NapE component
MEYVLVVVKRKDHGAQDMQGMEQRSIVYAGLFLACCAIALFAGPLVGLWGFVQAIVIIELGNWLAMRRGNVSRRRW